MRKFITWIWMRRNEGLIAKCLLFPLFLISLAVGIAARIRRARLAPKAHRAPSPR